MLNLKMKLENFRKWEQIFCGFIFGFFFSETDTDENIFLSFNTEILKSETQSPNANGLAERTGRTVAQLLRVLMEETEGRDWDELLPAAMMAVNNNVSSTTGYSPFEVIYGKKPRLPLDMLCGRTNMEDLTCDDYVIWLREKLQSVGQAVLTSQERATLVLKIL